MRSIRRAVPKKTSAASGRKDDGNVKTPVKEVLFVQGGGGTDVHDSWDNKLVASLKQGLDPGYAIRYPRMPDETGPKYRPWKSALKREYAKLQVDAVVVGHSIGGMILINALADEPPRADSGHTAYPA